MFEKLIDLLTRIAVALENNALVVASGGTTAEASKPPKKGSKAPAAPAADADDDLFGDDENEIPAKTYTKDEVRAIVVKYQKLPGVGQEKARQLVAKYGPAGTLGSIPADKYGALVAEAAAAGVQV